jgi:hypothetical protein
MRATLAGSLLVTLARPSTWVLALAAFLVRGGLLVFVIPIVVIPTPAGLADAIGPLLISFVFGGVSPAFVAVVATTVVVFLVWLIGGGLLAATAEAELIRVVATDEDVTTGAPLPDGVADGRVAARILAARLLAMLPFGAALAFGTTTIVAATYRELTLPGDAGTPIAWRVLRSVPLTVLLVLATWLLGEILGGIAARRIVLDGRPAVGGLRRALGSAVRRPVRTVVVFAVPSLGLLLAVVPSVAAASIAWHAVQVGLSTGDPLVTVTSVTAFVALWIGGLVLAGVACAWRHAAWTVDARGSVAPSSAVGSDPNGDWNPRLTSGTL